MIYMINKFCLGPMSKNIVDCLLEYSNTFKLPFTLIPSRRQIEYNGGYVNNWNTEDFTTYVKTKSNYIEIERDHGGPGQGTYDDDGYESFKHDCKFMDMLHIDPWKKYKDYNNGLNETIKLINYCYNENNNLYFEIGTEEAIRKFEVDEIEKLIIDLKNNLEAHIFLRIKYCVIQCGTGLLEGKNIGIYDENKLISMINVCKKYNLLSKEHNGDYMTKEIMINKFTKGLDTINIAPEMGVIETTVILEQIKALPHIESEEKFEQFFNICLESKKWVKWVSGDFIPENNKEELILICGHYVFSNLDFIKLKSSLSNIDQLIKNKIYDKLRFYHSFYDSYYKVLITTSGIGLRLGDYTKYNNKALLKIGDKFGLNYIIENYNKYTEFVITVGYLADIVKQFLKITYPNYKFTFVNIDKYDGDGSSLGYSLSCAKNELDCPFFYHCCDAIVLNNIQKPNENTIYLANHENSMLYATANISENNVIKINKKGEKNFDYVYTGVSFIKTFKDFWSILDELYCNNFNNTDLGDVDIMIQMLLNNINFSYKVFDEWYDSGSMFELNNKISKKFKCNYHVLPKLDESICFLDNYVIKYFYNKNVCLNRITRGNSLYPLTPKIVDSTDNFIKIEFIDGELMSNNNAHGEIKKLLNWSNSNLWKNYDSSNIDNFTETCNKFYYIKTLDRIKESLKTINDYSFINNKEIGGIYNLLEKINFKELCDSVPTLFHGDYVLDNIIKISDNNYKLIDWRQDFGGIIEYGDKYYDLAKLRHNIYFNHENIINNLYIIKKENNNVNIDLKCNFSLINQLNDYDSFVKENNLNIKKIKILCSLIWLNMSSLHEYPLNEFLFYFGKYNLYLNLLE